MKHTTLISLVCMKTCLGTPALIVVVLAGCIPADQPGLSDAVGVAPGEQVFGLISFTVAFARHLLAAFLF